MDWLEWVLGGLTEIGGGGMSARAVRRVNGPTGLVWVILGVLGGNTGSSFGPVGRWSPNECGSAVPALLGIILNSSVEIRDRKSVV